MIIPFSAEVGLIVAAGASGVGLSGIAGSLPSIPGVSIPTTIVFPRGFLADVTVEERHRDDLTVTNNPVEQGAAITDHAFKQPAQLALKVGFSNSNPIVGFALYVQIVYQLFLTLQASRFPFGLITGKRIYSTLLITSLSTFTDEKWENAMLLTVEMREIIIVKTKTVSVPSTSVMQAPGVNGATQDLGTSQLSPGSSANPGSIDASIGSQS